MRILHMLLAAAPPELSLPLEEVHAVHDLPRVLVEIGTPEAEDVVTFIHEDLTVQRAEPFRRVYVK